MYIFIYIYIYIYVIYIYILYIYIIKTVDLGFCLLIHTYATMKQFCVCWNDLN